MADGTRMQQRRATEAVWSTSGYVLAPGELGVTTDTGIIKIGNGTSPWSELDIAFDSQYLPLLGKAADSELLDGIDSAGYLKTGDATTAPTANKILQRLSDGRAQAAAATSGSDLVNFTQWDASVVALNSAITNSIITARSEAMARTFSDATTSITLAAGDVGGMVKAANSSLTVQRQVIIPVNSSVSIAVGSWIDVSSTDEGNLKLIPDTGVTLQGSPYIFGQYSAMRLIKITTNTWISVPFGARQRGRTPKIRLKRTGAGASYPGNTDTAIPYDTVDATQTFNPDNEWFAPPAGGYATERRIKIVQNGEYMIVVDFSGTLTAQNWLRINQMTASNTIGNRYITGPTFAAGQVIWTGRLSANDHVGAVHYPNGAVNTDVAEDVNSKNSITIIKTGN